MVKDTNNVKLRRDARKIKISINGNIVKLSNNIRLLGVQFQSNNRFTKNINIRINKARKAFYALRRLLSNR